MSMTNNPQGLPARPLVRVDRYSVVWVVFVVFMLRFFYGVDWFALIAVAYVYYGVWHLGREYDQ